MCVLNGIMMVLRSIFHEPPLNITPVKSFGAILLMEEAQGE